MSKNAFRDRRTLLTALVAALVLFQPPSAPTAQSGAWFMVVPVGDLSGGESYATGINNANDVVGTHSAGSPAVIRGFLYRNGGANTDIGTLAGGATFANSINDAGAITGRSRVGNHYHAFVHTGGAMRDLGTLTGTLDSAGADINAGGHVAGWSYNFGNFYNSSAFIWNGSSMNALPSLGGGVMEARSINTAGTIVGEGHKVGVPGSTNPPIRGFSYAGGVLTELAPLPAHWDSRAADVNDAGVIVGTSQGAPPNRLTSAVQWSNGTITELPHLPGGVWAEATSINAAGVIVGRSTSATSGGRAVRWIGGTVVDLNMEIPPGSGWELERASAINDTGAIAGTGVFNGVTRGFLLIPATDMTPPIVSCGTADGHWHATNVSIACTASDSESGLADPMDANFSLSTSVAAGTETPNAATGTRSVCDRAGNCTKSGPIAGNKIDRRAPAISISAPTSGTYAFLVRTLASYACIDGGSGLASCGGTVPNGAAIDTTSVGAHTFTVTASDAAGNTSTVPLQYQVVATNWSQFHYGAGRAGVQPSERVLDPTNVASLTQAWAEPAWNPIYASPAIVDGVAYIPSTDGHLYARSAAHGTALWVKSIGSFLLSSPAVVGGTVFIGSDDGNVYALDAASGQVRWRFPTGGAVYASPTVVGRLVFVGSWNGMLYALDTASGKPVWSANVGPPVRCDAAVVNNVVVLANDALYAFDAKTGKPMWTTYPSPSGVSCVAVANVLKGRLIVGANDGAVYGIDPYSGAVLWNAMTTYGTGGISGMPAVDGPIAYVGSSDGSLYAFEVYTGGQIWSMYIGGWVNSPISANGVVYAGSLGVLQAVDAQSGRVLWISPPVAGGWTASAAVADGTVYVALGDQNLYAFRR
jgi:probable HAF family extracellular repeat protein